MNIKNWLLAAVGVLVLSINEIGCSAAGSYGDDEMPVLTGNYVTADPALRHDTLSAIKRIFNASGVVVEMVPEDGVRVIDQPEVWVDDREVCGNTGVMEKGYGLYISQKRAKCISRDGIILHEMIHMLATSEHAKSGVFQRAGGNGLLNEDSLTSLCDHVPCTVFNPETSDE